MKKKILPVIALFFFTNIAAQKFEGLALTLPMGWNSWNTFQTNISDTLVRRIADVMISSGMKDSPVNLFVL